MRFLAGLMFIRSSDFGDSLRGLEALVVDKEVLWIRLFSVVEWKLRYWWI